tara:strand:- start:849 stop:1055 length:207 start_codon:yes stop_codon:yes gene_type:complete
MSKQIAITARTAKTKGKNQVVPILEAGIGMRVLSRKLSGSGTRVYVAPELGYVPGIDAPYGALNFGIL